MADQLRVFVSSVEKELKDERLIVQNLLSTDSFLSARCVPVLYEFEPASPNQAVDHCLRILAGSQVYLLIVGSESGTLLGDISMTHTEYRTAKVCGLPALVFIRGGRSLRRDEGTLKMLAEVEADGLKYKRFLDVVQLQKEVRAALVALLTESFGVSPSSDEDRVATQTIDATSAFESQLLMRVLWERLDRNLLSRLVASATNRDQARLDEHSLLSEALLRGLVWREPTTGEHYATAAGIVLLAENPAASLPQCRILADAYRGNEMDGRPSDHEDITLPLPLAIDRAVAFVERNTRHPMKVQGLNRIRLDEYPVEALREALVNAVAHRQYEDSSRRIILEVFFDRVVVSSPGMPPSPLTISKLRSGKYRPCSRNPVIAHSLSYFHRIEERGSGMRRMRDAMLDHGLDLPLLGSSEGYFQVTFPGPGEDLQRIRVPDSGLLVTPAIEAQLGDRQKKALARVLDSGSVTSGWLVRELGVTYDTANRDLKDLAARRILVREGFGRATRYVLLQRSPVD